MDQSHQFLRVFHPQLPVFFVEHVLDEFFFAGTVASADAQHKGCGIDGLFSILDESSYLPNVELFLGEFAWAGRIVWDILLSIHDLYIIYPIKQQYEIRNSWPDMANTFYSKFHLHLGLIDAGLWWSSLSLLVHCCCDKLRKGFSCSFSVFRFLCHPATNCLRALNRPQHRSHLGIF